MKCINPMKHRPEFEGKNHCSQCELEAQDKEFCHCESPIPHHLGVHPQTCRKCRRIIE
mgnify:FL=1|jgi:hypothetical protein